MISTVPTASFLAAAHELEAAAWHAHYPVAAIAVAFLDMKLATVCCGVEAKPTRPHIAVSACLLGHQVSYRGTAARPRGRRPIAITIARLEAAGVVTLTPVCPEHCAFGTPRAPVRLVSSPRHHRGTAPTNAGRPETVLVDSSTGDDKTSRFLTANRRVQSTTREAPQFRSSGTHSEDEKECEQTEHSRVEPILPTSRNAGCRSGSEGHPPLCVGPEIYHGWVGRAKSPSCGVADAVVFGGGGDWRARHDPPLRSDGLWTSMVKARHGLTDRQCITDAEARRDPDAVAAFLAAVFGASTRTYTTEQMDAVFAHFGRTFAEPCTLAHRRERLLALAIPHHVLNTDVTLYIGHRQWLPVSSSGDPRDGPRRSRTRGEPHQFGIDPAPWAAQRSCKAVLMHNLLRIESEEQALLAAACGADFDSAVESKWFIPSTKREHDSGPSSPTAAAAATRPVKAKARTGRSGGGRRPKKKTQPTAMPGEANLQGQDRVSSSFDVEAMERALSAASIDDDDEVLDPKSDSMNKTEVLLLFCRNGPLHADSVQKAQLRIDAALTVGRSAERDIAFMPHSISFLSLADVRLRHQSLASLFDAKKQLTSTQIRHLVQEYGATGVFQFVLERQFRRENHGARLDATRARQRIVSDTDEIAEMVQFCAWLDACDALRIICDYAPPAMVRAALAPTAETGADPTCAPLWLSVSKSAPCTIELLARGADATELHGAANHTRRALLPLACQHEEGYAALTYLLNLKSTRDVSAASQDGADAGSRDVECVPGASQLPATKTTTPVPRTTDEEASHADQEQCRGIPATLPASGATATPVNATIEFPRFTSPAGAQTAKDKLDHEFNFALLHLSSERRRRLAAARAALLATINDTGGVEGFTPLIEAARWGPYELCQLLLAHGADPSVEGTAGLTAVAYAEDRGQ